MQKIRPKMCQSILKIQTSEMTAKWTLTVVVLCCYSLAGIKAQNAIALASVGDNQNLTFTTAIDDYVIQNQRQYAANILAMEAELAAYKLNYEKQLAVMQQQSDLLEANMLEVDRRLVPLETLDKVTKHCVQKYKGLLATVASVKSSIANCVASANNAYASIVSPATTTKINLNNWYNTQLTSLINECKRKNANSQLNYTICVTQTIATADSVTISNQKTFNSQMQSTTCTGDSRTSQALDCTYTIVYNTVSRIGEVNRLIDNCNQGKEFCPVCPPPPPPTSVPNKSNYCANKISLDDTSGIFANETIRNPFYGLNATVPCVLVDFTL